MLRRAGLVVFLLLAACRQQPSFDERYKATQQRLEAKAAAIDKELASSATEPATPAPVPK